MKRRCAITCIGIAGLITSCAPAAETVPPGAVNVGLTEVVAEHQRLQELVGEWNTSAELTIEPDGLAVRSEGLAEVSSIGEHWIRMELTGVHAGEEYRGILTLGFDPRQRSYVASYVDDQCNHLWTYRGSMNAEGNALTLFTEGPVLGDEGRVARFREVYEFRSADQTVRTSYIQDGADWLPFATVDLRRAGQSS